MVRLPRQRGYMSAEDMDRLIKGYFFPDWLEEMYLFPPEPDLLRRAVRLALLHWT